MWKQILRQKNIIIISRSSISSLSNDVLRKRLTPYISKISYVDELSQTLPKLKLHRKASILLPLYCNKQTNRVEILVLKRSDKVRSHTGMVGKKNILINKFYHIHRFIYLAFAGGMSDLTDRDTIHTAEREAEEEIGLKLEHYTILGCLPPVADAHAIMITPVVALLNSPKFVDFCLSFNEATDAFYLDLEQFLYAKNNYKIFKIGDHFVIHQFDIDKYRIWGVTAFQLIVMATLVFQRIPEFPFFRHGEQLDLKSLTKQLQAHFRMCMNYQKQAQIQEELKEISRL